MKSFFRGLFVLMGLAVLFACSAAPTSEESSSSSSSTTSSVSSSSSTTSSVSSSSSSLSSAQGVVVVFSPEQIGVTNEIFGVFSDTRPNSEGLTWDTNQNGTTDYWLNLWAAPDGATVYELINGTSPAGDGNQYLKLYIKEGQWSGGITFALRDPIEGHDMSRFTNGYLVFSIAVPSDNVGDPIIALERQVYDGPNHRTSTILLTNGAYGFQKDGQVYQIGIPIAHFIQATNDEGLHGRMQASDFTNVGTFFQFRGQINGMGDLTNVILDNIFWCR